MRILMGIHRLWRGGGTETHVLTLAKQLQSFGHQVTIYTSGGEWIRKARNMGLSVKLKSASAPTQGTYIRTLQMFLAHHRFDVLHAHDGYSLREFTAAIKGGNQRPALIFTVHGPYVGHQALRRAQRNADAIVAVSPEIRRSLPSFVTRNKVHIVSNGIDVGVFHPVPKQLHRTRYGLRSPSFVVGYAGRFTFDKNALGKRVVTTVTAYANNRSSVEFLVAGRGSKHTVTGGPRVHVLGHVEQMEKFYRVCDVVIGTGRTAAEALLCGVPVIAVGKAGYHGIVTPANVSSMLRTNFGDHGPFRLWTPDMLRRDLRAIQTSSHAARQQIMSVQKNLMTALSSRRMATKMHRLYQKTSVRRIPQS